MGNRVFNLPIYTDPLNQQASPGNTFGAGFYATLGAGYQQPAGLGIWFKLKYLQTNIDANRVVQANSSILIPSLGFTKVF
ncbi:MAG: hypothetical protein U5L96_20910 [Owenweeksia sp.]|nr:hypothetical protein [Owenweeksia sp.]